MEGHGGRSPKIEDGVRYTVKAQSGHELNHENNGIEWAAGLQEITDSARRLPKRKRGRLVFARGSFYDLPLMKFGLHHTPAANHKDFRTVKISGLPVCTSIQQVLASVRGGAVFSACLCDTAALGSGLTALITFVEQSGADAFVDIGDSDGFYIGFHRAEVQLVRTATYPINLTLENQIFNCGYSRVLIAYVQDETLKDHIYSILSPSFHSALIERFVEHASKPELTMHFVSVKIAICAYDILKADSKLRETVIEFFADPCSYGWNKREQGSITAGAEKRGEPLSIGHEGSLPVPLISLD